MWSWRKKYWDNIFVVFYNTCMCIWYWKGLCTHTYRILHKLTLHTNLYKHLQDYLLSEPLTVQVKISELVSCSFTSDESTPKDFFNHTTAKRIYWISTYKLRSCFLCKYHQVMLHLCDMKKFVMVRVGT